jgi:hypothetical protein
MVVKSVTLVASENRFAFKGDFVLEPEISFIALLRFVLRFNSAIGLQLHIQCFTWKHYHLKIAIYTWEYSVYWR